MPKCVECKRYFRTMESELCDDCLKPQEEFEADIESGEKRWRARDEKELWLEQAIHHLYTADERGEDDGVGPSRTDRGVVTWLAHWLQKGWTQRQWIHASRVAKKYHRQVGQPPT